MQWLVLGLIVFLGVHSVRIVADDWRAQVIDRVGLGAWKAAVSLASLAGLALLAWGYALARQAPVVLWDPPLAARHAAALLTLLAFVLLVAAYVPGNGLKVRLRHPMVLGVKLWAFAHLLANGTLADLLLFGGFLVWAVFDYRAARRRGEGPPAAADGESEDDTPDTEPDPRHVVSPAATVATLVAGVVAWAAFAFWLHAALFGVAPFGR
ncbi:NnrU protein [Tepidimonas alkaliphilus]|uniref:NnrU protein n=1 Tax=Tepidimonas alkaliphilus TaxID=2588942 RepID=A0A554W6P7_9BURK|nr:NnrU family protein [Tepidimonas alkaliphilus]TSE19248.1 NnrU protein [Tepidimonas alkaliphilus]